MTGNRLKFGIGIGLILATVVWLAFTGFEESKAYYRTVEEVYELGKDAAGQRLKVGGDVEAGSIDWKEDGLHFVLVQETHSMPVIYTGADPVPDTFKDESQAVVEGSIDENGIATVVQPRRGRVPFDAAILLGWQLATAW